MEFYLKKLTLNNFKGIRELEIDFTDITNIYGANATGKTTIFDAFTWLLFNKDSSGSSTFGIKTLDIKNRVINHLEHSVEAILDVDDKEVTIKKIHQQNWVKKRGSTEPELEGSVNTFYWNDVPLKEKDYQEKLKSIIEPEIFSLITNPNKFNSLSWKEKREILFNIAGNITDGEIISKNKKLFSLSSILENKSLEEYKKEISAKKSKLKEDMKNINPRIDEVHKSIVDVSNIIDAEPLKLRIAEIDEALLDNQKAYNEYHDLQLNTKKRITALQNEIIDIRTREERESKLYHAQKEDNINSLERSISSCKQAIKNLLENTEYNQNLLRDKNEELEDLRRQSREKQLEVFVFDEDSCSCPVCKRKLDDLDIESQKQTLLLNFNTSKESELAKIRTKGESVKTSISDTQKKLDKNQEEIEFMENKITEIQEKLRIAKNSIIMTVKSSVKEIEDQISELQFLIVPYSDHEAEKQKEVLTFEKQDLQVELIKSQKQAMALETNQKAKQRILELEQLEQDIALKIAELEGQEFLLEEFTRDKINYTESKINSMFKMAEFKMFHYQVNGGIAETCETTYQGVPYSDLNTAARINVGIDIINVLTEFYGVSAPIFIDNRESVTEIIKTDSQVINLIVSESDKNLRIEG